MLKTQKKLIIIIGIIAAVLIAAYFVIVPILKNLNSSVQEIPDLLPGEVLGLNNRILMFEHVEQAGIQEIEVHNDYGVYAFYRHTDDEFYIRDNEGAPYSKTAFSSLVVSAGYTISMKRVTTDCPDMSEYGLDEASNPAWYKLTTIDGTEHIVYVGDIIPTGAGYYCRYDGRNAVYILSADISSTLLAPVVNLVSPYLAYPLATSGYFTVRDFYVYHYDECKIWIDYVEEGIETELPNSSYFEMKAPANYLVSTNYELALQNFTQPIGLKTVALGHTSDVMTAEELAPYGIDPENPAWTIHYKHSDIDNFIFLSEKNADGTYYAYSLLFNLVALVDQSMFSFLEWELIDYVNESLFMININDVAKIELETEDYSETFTLEGEGETLKVTPASTMATFGETDLKNFRQVYKTYLTIQMEGYADSTDTSELLLTLRFTTDDARVFEFKFYPYSTRRCFYTINGEGEFYVLRDIVDKAISDTKKVVKGEPVDSWAKN